MRDRGEQVRRDLGLLVMRHLSPLLWCPLFELDARAQTQQGVEVIEAVAEADHGEPSLQRTPSNAFGSRVIAANVETPPKHRLNSPMTSTAAASGC